MLQIRFHETAEPIKSSSVMPKSKNFFLYKPVPNVTLN